MKTFTIIADCMGGTFLSQHQSDNVDNLIPTWFEHFPDPLSAMLWKDGDATKRKKAFDLLDKEMLSLEPVQGLKSVWAGYFNIDQKDVFVHVVETRIDS